MRGPPKLPPKPARVQNKAKWAKLARKPSKKLLELARKLYAPAVALALVIGASAAGSGDADWMLLIPGEPLICAKSERGCRDAQAAIAAGRWDAGVPRDTPTVCRPSPSCFSSSSLVIKGFNDKR